MIAEYLKSIPSIERGIPSRRLFNVYASFEHVYKEVVEVDTGSQSSHQKYCLFKSEKYFK